jgi:hypothetical protein
MINDAGKLYYIIEVGSVTYTGIPGEALYDFTRRQGWNPEDFRMVISDDAGQGEITVKFVPIDDIEKIPLIVIPGMQEIKN